MERMLSIFLTSRLNGQNPFQKLRLLSSLFILTIRERLRISFMKKEEPEGTKIEEDESRTYLASGLNNTLHGNIYQLKLLMLFLKRGLDKSYSFRLATE